MAPGAVIGGGAGGGWCIKRERACGFVRYWVANQVQNVSKNCVVFGTPSGEQFWLKKGPKRKPKVVDLGALFEYISKKEGFAKIDDTYTVLKVFRLPWCAQKRYNRRSKSVTKMDPILVCIFERKVVPKDAPKWSQMGSKIDPKSMS